MTPDLIRAEYVKDYEILLSFDNGKTGTIDFSKFIKRGGIFSKLENLEYFKKFSIDPELFILKWSNEIDIAPEILYSEATGEPLPSWMNDSDEYRKAV